MEKHIDLDAFMKEVIESLVKDRQRDLEAKGTSVDVFPGKKVLVANAFPGHEMVMEIGIFFVDKEKWITMFVEGTGVTFMVKSSKGSWDELNPDFDKIINSFSTVAETGASPVAKVSAEDAEESRRLRQESEQAFFSRDYAEAEALMRRLLAIQEKTVGLEHNDAVRTLYFLGASLHSQGKRAEAEALTIRSASLGLLYALNYGQKDRVLALLEQGANPNVHDPRGRTALMYAGSAGQTLLLKKLLERGADVHATMPEEGTTALMAAINHGDPVAIRLLLSKGVDVSAKNAKGETALAWARRRLSMAPTERKFGGTTLPKRLPYGDLTAATKEEFEEIIALLKKAGAGN